MTFDEDDDDFDDADQERGGVIWGQWGVFFCLRVQSESEGIVVTAVSNIKRGRREGGSQSLTRGQKVKSRREREIFEERKRNFKCCFSILRREREIES